MSGNLSAGGVKNAVSGAAVTSTTVSPKQKFIKRKSELTEKIRKQTEKFLDQENERFRKINAKKLGLPENATWEDIQKENEKRSREGKIQITVPRWA